MYVQQREKRELAEFWAKTSRCKRNAHVCTPVGQTCECEKAFLTREWYLQLAKHMRVKITHKHTSETRVQTHLHKQTHTDAHIN